MPVWAGPRDCWKASHAGCRCQQAVGILDPYRIEAEVGLADVGHTWALQRADVFGLPLAQKERITTFVLYKFKRFGIVEPLQRFLSHIHTLS